MATRLILKSETHYRDIDTLSTHTEDVTISEYVENSDTISWHIETFVKLLLASGFSEGMIEKYMNYSNGEVFEIKESYIRYEVD